MGRELELRALRSLWWTQRPACGGREPMPGSWFPHEGRPMHTAGSTCPSGLVGPSISVLPWPRDSMPGERVANWEAPLSSGRRFRWNDPWETFASRSTYTTFRMRDWAPRIQAWRGSDSVFSFPYRPDHSPGPPPGRISLPFRCPKSISSFVSGVGTRVRDRSGHEGMCPTLRMPRLPTTPPLWKGAPT